MRGLFDRLIQAVNQKIQSAVSTIDRMDLGVSDLSARIEGRWIRLSGIAPSREVARQVVELFMQFVEVNNIRDAISVVDPTAPDEAEA